MRLRAFLASSVALGVAALATATSAHAEFIESLNSETIVQPDTSFLVTETIVYDFEFDERRGIYRDLVNVDRLEDESRRVYAIDVLSVTRDGQTEPFVLMDEGDYLRIRIGDPDVTITGAHTYQIRYTVKDGLLEITEEMLEGVENESLKPGDVEIYWDLIGPNWSVPIRQASASVSGPGDVLGASCWVGYYGSDASCPIDWDGDTVTFSTYDLRPGQALTGAVVYDGAQFTQPVVQVILPPERDWGALATALGSVIFLMFIVVPMIFAFALRREDKGFAVDLAPPQYSPPDSLTAAEVAATWSGEKESVKSRAIVATLVDLAARRWVNLHQSGKSIVVDQLTDGKDELRDWESALLDAVVDGRTGSGKIDGYDASLASTWNSSYTSFIAAAEKSGRRNPKGDVPDQRWNFLAFTSVAMVLIGFGLGFAGAGDVALVMIPGGIGAMLGFFVARWITPRRESKKSAVFLAKTDGLKRVLGTDAAEARREFVQRTGLSEAAIYATMLPYAVIFDLEHAWTGAFPDLTPDELETYGFQTGSMLAMKTFVSTFSSGVSSATTPPSRSSGSGFSGGGFSGGGGGGGGGGSW